MRTSFRGFDLCFVLVGLSASACSSSSDAPTTDAALLDAIANDGATTETPVSDAATDAAAGDSATIETAVGDAAATDGAIDGATDGAPTTLTTTVRVHYPAAAHTLTVRGSIAPLSWTSGVVLSAGASDTFTYTTTTVPASTTLELKPLLDETTWSLGPNYKVAAGASVDLYPHFTVTKGTYTNRWPKFHSKNLSDDRGVWVYLPPTYLENTDARLPVVYMHDGQNLFDASTAFGGVEWMVDETIDAAAQSGAFPEAIVVGPENTAARIDEYTPTFDSTVPGGGKGDLYLKMLIEELKPQVDAELRTLTDRGHTAIVGSSLGGLISAYAGTTRSDVFGLVGAMSPSTWWSSQVIIADVSATAGKSPMPMLVYVDSGDSGPDNDDVTFTTQLYQAYLAVGFKDTVTSMHVIQVGGQHNELYWSQRLPGALGFLLGPGR